MFFCPAKRVARMEEKKVVFPQGQKKKQTTTVDPESGDYPMRTLWVRVERTWVWDIRGRKVKVPFKLMYLNKVSLRHDKHFFRDLDGFFISFFFLSIFPWNQNKWSDFFFWNWTAWVNFCGLWVFECWFLVFSSGGPGYGTAWVV